MILHPRHLFYSLVAIFSCSNALPCMARDVYLAIRGDGGGSGTQNDPYDAGSRSAYDSILTRFTSDTDFHYAPGTYQTQGWTFQQHETAHAGVRHHGAGVDQTVIQLNGSDHGLIFGADWNHPVNGFELHDLTLDCNAQGNPVFNNHQGAVSAFMGVGNDILLQHLKVINFGTSRQGYEDFVVFVGPSSAYQGQTFNNITFDGIEFSHPASGNADGTTIAAMYAPPGVTINGKISNCRFIDCRSDFTYSHAFNATDCESNYVQNVSNGVYFEPTDSQDHTWTFRNNTFVGVDYGLLVNWHPGAHLGSLIFDNNQVSLSNNNVRRAALGVSADGLSNGSSSINYIEFNNNTVNLASYSGSQAPASSVSALDLRGQHYTVNQLVGSGNNISLPGNSNNIDGGVVGNLSLQ